MAGKRARTAPQILWPNRRRQKTAYRVKNYLPPAASINKHSGERNQAMNEVTKIHIGRQAYTKSLAAQRELRHYLDAIAKEVDDSDVSDEIELRMAELLTERGVK